MGRKRVLAQSSTEGLVVVPGVFGFLRRDLTCITRYISWIMSSIGARMYRTLGETVIYLGFF